MKRFLAILMIMVPMTLMAQKSAFDTFFEKYSGKENYTTVDLSTDFLKMIMGFSDEKDDDINELVSNIDRIRIVVCQENNPVFAEEATKLVASNKEYKQITNVNSGGEVTRIHVIQKQNKVTDFMLISTGKTECVVINIIGKNLDVSKVSNLSKNMQIKL